MTNSSRSLLISGALCLAAASQAHAANLITNGGFEDGVYSSTVGGYTNGGVPVGWTANAGFDSEPGFNHVGGGTPNSGSTELSISNYDYEPLATLSQTFADVAGATYTVTFYGYDGGANGDSNAYLSVSAGGSSITFGDALGYPYTEGVFTFIGSGSDTLTISAQTNPSEWYVDDVSVTGATGVPEPGVWTLMLAGLGGLGLALRGARRARIARPA